MKMLKNYIKTSNIDPTGKWMSRISFWLFVAFTVLYFILNQNLILGVIAIINLFYWNLSNITSIVMLFKYNK